MPSRDHTVDEDALPVMVPRSEKRLVATPAERVQRLKAHLAQALDGMSPSDGPAPIRPEPAGFPAQIIRSACTLCRGWCCRNGGDDAFLDACAMARVHHAQPCPDIQATVQVYLDRVPDTGYEGSCIFHGSHGCTLDRSMRSDVCNAYFCGGLHAYLSGGETYAPTVVIAGEGRKMQTSRVLLPGNTSRRTP